MKRRTYLWALLMAAIPASVWSQTFPPSQDAYVVPGNATNFGSATAITVGSSGSRGLVQFDLTSLPAGLSSAQIAKATLTLYASTVGAPGTISVYAANGTWTEAGVTGLNAPVDGAAAASNVSIPTTAKGEFVTIDVTTAVQNWIAGTTPNNGFVIEAGSGASVQFDSKESTNTSHFAMLSVSLSLGPVARKIGGSVTNLTANGLQVQMNGGPALSIPSGASSYNFPAKLYTGQTYQASIAQQPTPGSCGLSSTTGTVPAADVTSLSVICSGPPGAPTAVTAVGTTFVYQNFVNGLPASGSGIATNPSLHPSSIHVSWTPPASNGGTPITTYTVTAQPSGQTQTVGGTSADFTSLDATKNWTFTVVANNIVGAGAASSASNTIGPPGLPSNVTFTTSCGSNFKMMFSWTPSTNTGGSSLIYGMADFATPPDLWSATSPLGYDYSSQIGETLVVANQFAALPVTNMTVVNNVPAAGCYVQPPTFSPISNIISFAYPAPSGSITVYATGGSPTYPQITSLTPSVCSAPLNQQGPSGSGFWQTSATVYYSAYGTCTLQASTGALYENYWGAASTQISFNIKFF